MLHEQSNCVKYIYLKIARKPAHRDAQRVVVAGNKHEVISIKQANAEVADAAILDLCAEIDAEAFSAAMPAVVFIFREQRRKMYAERGYPLQDIDRVDAADTQCIKTKRFVEFL